MNDKDCIDGTLPTQAVMLETLLTVDKVTKGFELNNGKRLPVLSEVSLSVKNIQHKPQILSILGPSGGGKTTLLRILAGLDKPDSGEVSIDEAGKMRGVKIGDIGVVFQRYPLFDDRNVLQNLVEPALNSGLNGSEARAKAEKFLDEFGLEQQASSFPLQLSGGQRQRVAIAQQLIQDRHYVILDEPFSGLDPNNIHNVISLLQRIANQHTKNTFIIVTHDITSALIISDRVVILGKTSPNEGSKIVKDYDLIKEGLAYQPNIEDLPRFQAIRKEIKYVEFPKLSTQS
jgi:ABC-type nitrate/sulfonate/bicarbonate transport system ATPase subunit